MTRLKMCGMRDAASAVAAADAGVDYLGFVFVHGVRRQLTEEEGRRVISDFRERRGEDGPMVVGLFANQPVEEVNRIVRICGLDAAQLCGDEPPEYWERVETRVIRQVKVEDTGSRDRDAACVLALVAEAEARGCLPHLDSHKPGAFGGTGQTFDWSIAREAAERHDLILAGGLDPDNVGAAIGAVRPWGVDVSSGVETGGVKDVDKIAAFAAQVRASR